MCRRVECEKCHRPTFAGCGAHVEQVLGDVPVAARCNCRDAQSTPSSAAGTAEPLTWLQGIFGKK